MRPIAIIILAALAAGLLAFGLLFFRPKLTLTVSPDSADVSFAGMARQGGGSFTTWPGRYELVIEKEGYIPLKRTEKLGIGQRLALTVALRPIPKPVPLTDEPVLLVGLAPNQQSVLYVGNSGKTLFARNGGEQRPMTPDSFNWPILFQTSPTLDVAVLKNPNGDYFLHDFKRYNLVEQKQFFYGRDISGIDWLYPKATSLLYAYAPPGGERSLILADRTNKELNRVLNLKEAGIFDPTVSVSPDGKTAVLVSRPGKEFSKYNMFLVDLFTNRARQLTTDGSKIEAKFSPSGKSILYTRFEQDPDGLNNQMLSVMDADGKNRKDFALRANLDQVAFLSENVVVVAVAGKGGSQLIRLDLASGATVRYYHENSADRHINKLVVSSDNKSVYITADQSAKEKRGTLYIIQLATDGYE